MGKTLLIHCKLVAKSNEPLNRERPLATKELLASRVMAPKDVITHVFKHILKAFNGVPSVMFHVLFGFSASIVQFEITSMSAPA